MHQMERQLIGLENQFLSPVNMLLLERTGILIMEVVLAQLICIMDLF